MLELLKDLLQLILSPGNGWEDIEKSRPDADHLLKTGLYPLLGVMTVTRLLDIFYYHTHFGTVITGALCTVGAYFVSIFIAKLIFELSLPNICKDYSSEDGFTVIVFGISLMTLMKIIANCIPWQPVILSLLPLYVILVVYRSLQFLHVRKDCELRYLGIEAVAIAIVPLAINYSLDLLI